MQPAGFQPVVLSMDYFPNMVAKHKSTLISLDWRIFNFPLYINRAINIKWKIEFTPIG